MRFSQGGPIKQNESIQSLSSYCHLIFYAYAYRYLDAKGDGIIDKTTDDLFTLKLIKTGDKLAFKHLFKLYFTPLYRFVHLYTKKPGAAEDIVVDIFASFWERRETLRIQITLEAYLFQPVWNRALSYLRDNERFISTDDFSSLERFESDETLETQELQRPIHEATFSLPPKCRDVFNKNRTDNLSNKEIVEQMNISIKAVEGHISRASKQIRAYLGDAYHYLWWFYFHKTEKNNENYVGLSSLDVPHQKMALHE